MNHPEWFQKIMLSAAHTAFTSEFWSEIEQRQRDEPDKAFPWYPCGTALCSYTDEIPEEDRATIANAYDRHLQHYFGVDFWTLCCFVFELDENEREGCRPPEHLHRRIARSVGRHFLGMLGHGVSFWDDEMDAQEKAEEKFPGLKAYPILRAFDDVPELEMLLTDMVDKHFATVSQSLPQKTYER